jgi:hypothetical protein
VQSLGRVPDGPLRLTVCSCSQIQIYALFTMKSLAAPLVANLKRCMKRSATLRNFVRRRRSSPGRQINRTCCASI